MESAPEPRGAETVWMFRRALAFVHLWAFGSLWTQLDGLIGPQGIRPAGEFVERARAALTEQGDSLWTALPTLAWFTGAGPTALHLFCAGGMLAALVLLFVDAASTYALATLYLLYLSLFGIASEFLHYQWDILLLEVTFAALFYTPRIPRTVWLPRLIAFKLMFSAGVVKLASGDPTWRDLSALDFHYWTQPIPHFGGWLAWQMPGHAVSCVLMFAIELGVPFLIFIRPYWAFWPFVALMSMMAATGNYGFFHLLSVTLFLSLVPDGKWRKWSRGRLVRPAPPSPPRWAHAIWLPIGWLALLSVLHLGMLGPRRARPAALVSAYQTLVGPFDAWQMENAYGLFASMTTERLEIQLEGSDDGVTWKKYRFKYKPFDAHDLPLPALFHMPRLDWQMWFAALGTYRQNAWFMEFQRRILEGSPAVLDLLAENPFPDAPPQRLRARTERFEFADDPHDGVWTVTPVGPYSPEVSLNRTGSGE